ncbi:MAG: YeeE/YedE family protein [Dehalobacter sp.]|nr:YeeE/YedE family protein [Dehalobacter sp.]
MTTILIPILIGLFFGFALQKAGLGHYDKIVNQFRFKDNTMMKFMMSAISVGLVGIYFLKDIGFLNLIAVPDTYVVGNLVGGLLFGIGMAIAGTCPGTLIVGVGQGNLDYLIPGFLGFLTGAVLFGIAYQPFFLKIYPIASYGRKTLEDLFHINHWFIIVIFVLMTLVFYFISKKREHSLSTQPQMKEEGAKA